MASDLDEHVRAAKLSKLAAFFMSVIPAEAGMTEGKRQNKSLPAEDGGTPFKKGRILTFVFRKQFVRSYC